MARGVAFKQSGAANIVVLLATPVRYVLCSPAPISGCTMLEARLFSNSLGSIF